MESLASTALVLSFEDFTKLDAKDNFLGRIYKKGQQYLRFSKEHLEMNCGLNTKIQGIVSNLDALRIFRPYEHDIYEAYKIMNVYEYPDQGLFV